MCQSCSGGGRSGRQPVNYRGRRQDCHNPVDQTRESHGGESDWARTIVEECEPDEEESTVHDISRITEQNLRELDDTRRLARHVRQREHGQTR